MKENSSQTVTKLLGEACEGKSDPLGETREASGSQASGGESGSQEKPVEERSKEELAEEKLYEAVYTELRRRAHQQRRRWKGEPTLRTTALAHEAYLKLVHQEERSWESRSHFLAVAGKAMRHILIDRARRKRAQKRGGEQPTLSLEELRETLGREIAMTEEDAEAFVLLEEALGQLEEKYPRAARVVECRFFSGMTIKETAAALGVSTATVSRDWKQAKAWLYRKMKQIRGESTSPRNEDPDEDTGREESSDGSSEQKESVDDS